jgi:hypothetical protein
VSLTQLQIEYLFGYVTPNVTFNRNLNVKSTDGGISYIVNFIGLTAALGVLFDASTFSTVDDAAFGTQLQTSDPDYSSYTFDNKKVANLLSYDQIGNFVGAGAFGTRVASGLDLSVYIYNDVHGDGSSRTTNITLDGSGNPIGGVFNFIAGDSLAIGVVVALPNGSSFQVSYNVIITPSL